MKIWDYQNGENIQMELLIYVVDIQFIKHQKDIDIPVENLLHLFRDIYMG
jgi:hypothetical protein